MLEQITPMAGIAFGLLFVVFLVVLLSHLRCTRNRDEVHFQVQDITRQYRETYKKALGEGYEDGKDASQTRNERKNP